MTRACGLRRLVVAAAVIGAAACARGSTATDEVAPSLVGAPDACAGLACKRVSCPAGATTRITGRVLDPAGLRGIYNVSAYVPSSPPQPVVGFQTTFGGPVASRNPIR